MESALDDVEPLLPERSLGDILNETFVIYGRHFAKFLGLAGQSKSRQRRYYWRQ